MPDAPLKAAAKKSMRPTFDKKPHQVQNPKKLALTEPVLP